MAVVGKRGATNQISKDNPDGHDEEVSETGSIENSQSIVGRK